MSRRVVVYGGRKFNNRRVLFSALDEILWSRVTVVHGGAPGADSLAGAWAREHEYDEEPHPADWDIHGKAAGFIRNQEMVDSGLDLAIEFPGGTGTADMRRRLKRAGVPIISVPA